MWGVCYVCMVSFVQAQNPVAVELNINDFQKIRPNRVEVQFGVEGVAELDYLQVQSADKFAATKLGYSEEGVYKQSFNFKNLGYQFLEMTIKDLSGIDNWNKIKIGHNDSYPRTLAVADYLGTAEALPDGWLKIKIPLSDLNLYANISHLTFPHANHVNLGVKEIVFTGPGLRFEWFGARKYDNAIKENVAGQSQLVFSTGGIHVDEMRLEILNHENELVQSSMPFEPFHPTLLLGENKLLAVVVDEAGVAYYSDTLVVSVPAGLTYEVTHVTCAGGTDGGMEVTIDGGTPPYIYAWDHGADTEDISDVPAGVYELLVTDAEGKTASLTAEIKAPNELTADLESISCSETEVVLHISGGKAPYQYNINGGDFIPMEPSLNKVWEIRTNQSPDEELKANFAHALERDGMDNIYVAGDYANVLDFGEGSVGEENRHGTYLVKFDSDGSFGWSFSTLGGSLKDLAVDAEGNSIIIVEVIGSASLINYGNMALSKGSYIIKVDKNGRFEWLRPFFNGIGHVSLDAFANVYAAGIYTYSSNEGGQGPSDIYLAKYDASGILLWKKMIGGDNIETINDMFVNSNSDVFITGGFASNIYFDGLLLESKSLMDLYVAKMDGDGNAIWARSRGGNEGNDSGLDIIADESGKVFITALFSANSEFSYSTSVNVLSELNGQDGSIMWDRPYAYAGYPNFSESYELATGNTNELYMSVHGGGLILRGDENFGVISDQTLLIKFNKSGDMLTVQETGVFSYEPQSRNSPIAFTKDNHIVYCDLLMEFAIVKQGAAMQQELSLSTDDQEITVRDANGCTFTLEDLSFEKSPLSPPAICYVMPAESGSGNILSWTFVEGQDVTSFNIYRETYATEEFEIIGSVEAGTTAFEDTTVNVLERSYRYVVTAIDPCGVESDYSEAHKTMHLTVNQGNTGQINLIWDGYQGFDYKSVQVYRGSSYEDMELLTELPSYLFTYTDFDPSPSTLYYQTRVESEETCVAYSPPSSAGRLAGEQQGRVVHSNTVTRFGQAGELQFFPNPGSEVVNLKFSPDGDTYQLRLIDAKGRVVKVVDNVFDTATIDRDNLPAGIYNVILNGHSGKVLHGRIAFR